MPKRKSNPCGGGTISLSSLDAALDILACETFTRLDSISTKFEAAAGVKLNEGVVHGRWEEAVKRYWVMKDIDGLCCTAKKAAEDTKMEEAESEGSKTAERRDSAGRILPEPHAGPVPVHNLSPDEEHEWRKWSPKVGDLVLCQLEKDGIWPGKIIDKKLFFTGRTMPKGNHFFPVRIYNDELGETLTIKSRLIPYSLRPSPPLLASPALQSAYHHADHPESYDSRAVLREQQEAHTRTHPGIGDEIDREALKAQKQAWNTVVNWVMNERRGEKMRNLVEEREKRLREVAKVEFDAEVAPGSEDDCPFKKQRRAGGGGVEDNVPALSRSKSSDASVGIHTPWNSNSPSSSIFGAFANHPPALGSPRRTSSPALVAGFIRPSLATPQRPNSPRRFDRRSRMTGMGEYSPRGRGGTYTPPRILPSGDETAPNVSPVPSGKFDFVSSLGPNGRSSLSGVSGRKGSLEAVKEEDGEGWTVIGKGGRSKRADSAPCAEKGAMERDYDAGREDLMVS